MDLLSVRQVEYIINLTVIGLAALGMAWMPAFSKKTGISYAIIYVLLGVLVYSLIPGLPYPDPLTYRVETIHITELVVIISIMGTGIKIDEPFSLKRWRVPFRLVLVTMVLSIAVTTLLGWYVLGMDIASALLLGAVLAPTDPVLASDVQVGPPNDREKNNVKFALTAEAGMNDGTAFPFVWLAITVAAFMDGRTNDLTHELSLWFLTDLIYRIATGLLCGYITGRILAAILFGLPGRFKTAEVNDGFVAVAATLFVYGFTELLHGYGFIAVFVTAVTLRNHELYHQLHEKLHSFTDQIERMLVAIVLVLLGGSLASNLLDTLSWQQVVFGFVFLLVIRPVASALGLLGTGLHRKEKMAISFFGIRGVGTFFYLAYALEQTMFDRSKEIWSQVIFIVLLSIAIHGLTAGVTMEKLTARFARRSGKR